MLVATAPVKRRPPGYSDRAVQATRLKTLLPASATYTTPATTATPRGALKLARRPASLTSAAAPLPAIVVTAPAAVTARSRLPSVTQTM
jgi:hypothetical protein